MEDYDKFVQRRLSQLKKSEEEDEGDSRTSPTSSLICFYGRAILPPLLSVERREEMQRHRDEARRAARHRKLKDDPRMAYVQTILHSVQLRKTPTLEELLQESEIKTKPLYSHNTSGGSISQSDDFIGTKDSLSLSPRLITKEADGVSLPPMRSLLNSAFFTSDVIPLQSYHEGCLVDQHDCQQVSQPSSLNSANHQSLSSGYVTNENETTFVVSTATDAESKSPGFDTSEGPPTMGGFFLHSTSNTIAKMPEIISYPPIDGEELERSGLESSFCNYSKEGKDICCPSFQVDSVICDNSLTEKSETSHLDSTNSGDNPHSTVALDFSENHISDRSEDPVPSSENRSFSDNSQLSEILKTDCHPTATLHSQHEPTQVEPADNHEDEEKPSEEPYRLSLQALLKKSQEYRRRQRILRNQAKNTKIQERTQELPSARAEEQSLSDKENDESSYKGTVTAEGKNTKERRGTSLTAETSSKKSFENERMNESEFSGEQTNVGAVNSKAMTRVEKETTFKYNKMNSSQAVITESKQTSPYIQLHSVSTEASPPQESFYLTGERSNTCRKGVFKGVGTMPAPNFCMSPERCKSKGSMRDGQLVGAAETSKVKVVVSEDSSVKEESNLGHGNSYTAAPSAVNLTVEGDVTSVLAKSSDHINQLESNLSSLKVLISDLESSVKENLENHSTTETNAQSDFREGVKNSEPSKNDPSVQLRHNDCDHWEDKLRDDDADSTGTEYNEFPRRQLFSDRKNLHERPEGPEPIFSEAHDVPLIFQEKGKEAVDLREIRLIKTLATGRVKDKGTGKEGFTKSYAVKQQPPAKCILSAAQWMRIPDAFRNIPSETIAPFNASVLSDTSNYPVERRNEMTVEGHDSTCSPSLNQSYDVDTPSGLWILEGQGFNLASKGHLVQEKHLTPESDGEGQDGVFKVKRRLLMHTTEETQERSADTSGGAGCVVRPSSSTPKGALRWHGEAGSQKKKEEQLKEAHAAQIRALQDEHRRQQEELLQALAARCHLLQSVSFPCSMSTSRLGDTMTFPTLSQPSGPLSEHYRPLLTAAVRGFLTRRLLRTERVAQLVRTIRDTQQFLYAFQQQQSPSRGEFCSRQDLLLQERVTLQLRAARYEIYDIFFSLSAAERMQLISWDRELTRERELRRQSGHTEHLRGKSSLSAATQKSLQRKRGEMIQKKAAVRRSGVVMRTGRRSGSSAEQPLETKRGQFTANPQRVPKSTYSSRPR